MPEHASVLFLGTRGTVPVENEDVAHYGGKTACVLLRMGASTVILDGGTGIMELGKALEPGDGPLHLLLSHPHADHLMGLPACPVLFDPAREIRIYGADRNGLSIRDQLARLMSPPLWPVEPDAFTARVSYHSVCSRFTAGNVAVRTLEGAHPGGCTAYRLECGGVSVVYASDYELDEQTAPLLEAFAKDCTLLLCDGQYTDAEFERHRGFGHSTWQAAAQLAAACGAHCLRIVHHAPGRTDKDLAALEPQLRAIFDNGSFARCGEEMQL